MTAADDNWLAVVGNLKKAWKRWDRLTSILGQEGANPRVSRIFGKAVVQAVLILGSETWVLTPCMGQDLGRFQHEFEKWIMGRQTGRK